MHFDRSFFQSAITEVNIIGNRLKNIEGWSVDSRTINPNEVFIAIKGQNCDGHNFISEAINKGCAGIIIERSKSDIINNFKIADQDNFFIAIVDNSEKALVNLAKKWREGICCPIVGVTGSIGKTSTKEILANILKESKQDYLASYGNQNTAIGISLNILKLNQNHKVGIFEIGINKIGEMDLLVDIVKPTIALITYIGHNHMEGLGTINNIASEKRNIFKLFNENNIGIINGDQAILSNIGYKHPIARFGFKTTNQIQARKVKIDSDHCEFILKIYQEKFNIKLNTAHEGRILNILAACTAAYILNIGTETIVKAIQNDITVNNRFEHKNIKNSPSVLINDCYNASPESMKAALIAFEKLKFNGTKIAVLGDMLELGTNTQFWHRQLGRFLRKTPSLDYLILVGELVKSTKNTIPVNLKFEHVKNWQEATIRVEELANNKATILVKGSKGIGLLNLVSKITENQK